MAGSAPPLEAMVLMSDIERQALRESLDQARADIAAGRFDVVTSDMLKQEFDGIFEHDETDEELDARLQRGAATVR